MISNVVIAFVAAATVALLTKLLLIGRRPSNYPPGPPTLPLIGNLHQMPTSRPHEQFQKWAQEYGWDRCMHHPYTANTDSPIYSLMLGTRTYVVLSSDVVIKDLLDKKSNMYSDRPDMYMGQDIASGGLRLVVMKYGPLWRLQHKMVHNILNIKAAETYVPYQDLENRNMLLGFLDEPNEFVKHIQRYTVSLTTQMVFGFRTSSIDDPKVAQLFEGFENWGKLINGASSQLLDLFPILQRLPPSLRPNYRYAQELHRKELGLYLGHWMNAKEGLQNGTGKPCFCNDLLRVQKQEGMSDAQAAYLSGSLLEAGSDTTSSILIGFVQAMMVFPEAQKLARAEIDRVVGKHRLPTMADASSLPYIRGCVKESIRWMPTTPLGVPHSTPQADTYMGYKIPAGATIINNVWTLQMDPHRNPDPRRFDPSRFSSDASSSEFASATAADPSKRNNYIFGAGRRLCQGMHIAERSLFLAISRMVWAFEFQRPVDAVTGEVKPLPDIDDLVGGVTVRPADFEVVIKPRSEEKARIIREMWRECEEGLLDGTTKQWKQVPEGMAFSTLVPEKGEL